MTSRKRDGLPTPAEALEAALVANPDDLAAHNAYADWLMEQGDPRGEFIQVQLALEDEKRPTEERERLRQREQELLKQHQRKWLGELAPFLLDQQFVPKYHLPQDGNQFQFARGWLDTVHFSYLTVDGARALARTPHLGLLRRLAVSATEYAGDPEDMQNPFAPGDDVPADSENPCLYPLQNASFLNNLRIFQLGETYHDDERWGASCHINADGIEVLVPRMLRLEELHLMAHAVDMETLFALPSLGSLRVLEVDHQNGRYPLEMLAANPALARLQRLTCHPHGLDDEDAYIRLPELRAVLRSPHLKALNHLTLRCTDVGDPGCQEIVDSGALKRLRALELPHGCITDHGARILAACPDLRRLELLNLNYNGLTTAGVEALRATGIPTRLLEQHTAEEIDNRLYLFEADPE